jgi:hypothetical protein
MIGDTMNTNISTYQTKVCLIDEESGDPTDKLKVVNVITQKDYDGILIEIEGMGMDLTRPHHHKNQGRMSIQIISDIDGKSLLVNIYQPESEMTDLPVSSMILK